MGSIAGSTCGRSRCAMPMGASPCGTACKPISRTRRGPNTSFGWRIDSLFRPWSGAYRPDGSLIFRQSRLGGDYTGLSLGRPRKRRLSSSAVFTRTMPRASRLDNKSLATGSRSKLSCDCVAPMASIDGTSSTACPLAMNRNAITVLVQRGRPMARTASAPGQKVGRKPGVASADSRA